MPAGLFPTADIRFIILLDNVSTTTTELSLPRDRYKVLIIRIVFYVIYWIINGNWYLFY